MGFDLHTHTNFSDGILSPVELVDLSIKSGLEGIAITDHDTVLGIDDAIKQSKKYFDFIVIPGIEFGSVHNNEEVHILGYFIDYKNDLLLETIKKLHESRYERAIKMIKKLVNLNIDLSIEDVLKHSSKDNIGRPHIARAMIEKGYVKNVSEAFDIYLDRGKIAYVDRYQLSVEDTIKLIHFTGGIASLAHPGLLKDKLIIEYCIRNGIDAIEAKYTMHSDDEKELYINIARKNNLLITGGSDFHGDRGVLGDSFVDLKEINDLRGRLKNV